jgi:hypothetical protein
MRWEVSGGQVVVTLRVVLLSGVWEATVAKWLGGQQFPTPGVTDNSMGKGKSHSSKSNGTLACRMNDVSNWGCCLKAVRVSQMC